MSVQTKRYLIVIYFVIFSFGFSKAQSVWNKYYNYNLDNWVASIDTLSDGSIYLAGRESDLSGGGNYFVSKLDSNGNELWHRIGTRYLGFIGDNGAAVINGLADGGCLIAGSLQMQANIYNIYIMRYDSVGNLLWERNFGNNYSQIISSVVTFGNAFFATVISISAPPSSYIFQFNEFGDSISSRSLPLAISTNPSSCLKFNDTSMLIVGQILDTVSGIQNLATCKVDTEGNVLEKNIYADSISFEAETINVAVDDDYVVSGFSFANSISKLLKVDSVGNIKWTRQFYNLNKCVSSTFANGDVLFCLGSSDSAIVINRFSAAGVNLSSDTIPQPYLQSELLDNIVDRNENLLLSGWTFDSNTSMGSFSRGFITKIVLNSTVDISHLNTSEFKFVVFPNPINHLQDNLNVYSDGTYPFLSLSIFSYSGVEIYKQEIQGIVEGTLQLFPLPSNLQSGIYFVKVFDPIKKSLLVVKKVIVY